MTCYHPLQAYKSLTELTERGKAVITFAPPKGPSEVVRLPCGQCIGCRLDKSLQWALRCVHEASMHDENSFVTLTYDEKHLPTDESLCKRHHQDFIRRLRREFPKHKVRYFLCGEYGDTNMRPHYHALLFGIDFPDKTFWSESKENKIYISPDLLRLWPFGLSWIGSVTWQSAAYVARYVLKKVNGDNAWERYCKDINTETGECRVLEPEYIAMSRRPGIGREWYRAYKKDARKDFLTHDGKKFKLPRYYDQIIELEDIERYRDNKRKRQKSAREHAVGPRRLQTLEAAQEYAAKKLERIL